MSPPLIEIRPIARGEWRLARAVRLAALADSPHAFASTLAEEQAMPDELWQRRTEDNAAGSASTLALAFAGAAPIGMAVGVLETETAMRLVLD